MNHMTELSQAPKAISSFAVDADIVAWKVGSMNLESSLDALHEGIDLYLYDIARCTGITEFALYITSENNFRYDVAFTKPYKHNRQGQEIPLAIPEAKKYMEEKYKAFIVDGYEADDAIASRLGFFPSCAHAGIDKDIRNSVEGWHYHFDKREWVFTDYEDATLALWRQVCSGDSGDGIPGLKGIGAKKAEALVYDVGTARQQALKAYLSHDKIDGTLEQRRAFFDEQRTLITLVDNIEVVKEHQTVEITAPKFYEENYADEEWNGEGLPEVDIKL